MAENKTATATAQKPANEAPVEVNEITTADISQAFRLLRFRLNTLAADARRRNPFMSRSQEEAKAKFAAAFKSIIEMSDFLDKQSA